MIIRLCRAAQFNRLQARPSIHLICMTLPCSDGNLLFRYDPQSPELERRSEILCPCFLAEELKDGKLTIETTRVKFNRS